MKRSFPPLPWPICGLLAGLLVAAIGCSRSADDEPKPVPVPTLAEAESKLQETLASAPAEVKSLAATALETLRVANYEKAMESLQALKARKDLTPEQYMAVHESEVVMVDKMIAAMQAGDANAKRAHEAYQKTKD